VGSTLKARGGTEAKGQRLGFIGSIRISVSQFSTFQDFIFSFPAWIDFAPFALFVAARRLEARGGPARLEFKFKIRAFAALLSQLVEILGK